MDSQALREEKDLRSRFEQFQILDHGRNTLVVVSLPPKPPALTHKTNLCYALGYPKQVGHSNSTTG